MISYKHSNETLDYVEDWVDWLDGDTITNAVWTVPTGLTSPTESFTTTTTTVWLSGGTAGATYESTVVITTAAGRTGSRSVTLHIYPSTILTPEEAANVLRCEISDALMLDLLPAIDAYIFRATGKDWAGDSSICPEAKASARILLVQWHEDPGMMTGGQAVLSGGLSACLAQLEAMARYYYTFEGLEGAGYIPLSDLEEGDTVITLIGKVGATGDQSAKFESVITENGYLQQTSSDDLSEKWYTAYIKPPQEM